MHHLSHFNDLKNDSNNCESISALTVLWDSVAIIASFDRATNVIQHTKNVIIDRDSMSYELNSESCCLETPICFDVNKLLLNNNIQVKHVNRRFNFRT